jgi:hypothetical protein
MLARWPIWRPAVIILQVSPISPSLERLIIRSRNTHHFAPCGHCPHPHAWPAPIGINEFHARGFERAQMLLGNDRGQTARRMRFSEWRRSGTDE